MAEVNVRRRGTGDPEATFEPGSVGPLGSEPVGGTSAGAAKVSSLAHAVPRHAGRSDSPSRVLLRSSSVRRPRPRPVRCQGRATLPLQMSNLSVNRRAEARRGPHWR